MTDLENSELKSTSCRGFSLPEALIALAIFGFAVVAAASFLSTQLVVERRLAAREELLRLVEAGLESVRGGVVPLQPSVFTDDDLTDVSLLRDPVVVVDVHTTAVPDLFDIEVTARGGLMGEEVSLSVHSKVWRP